MPSTSMAEEDRCLILRAAFRTHGRFIIQEKAPWVPGTVTSQDVVGRPGQMPRRPRVRDGMVPFRMQVGLSNSPARAASGSGPLKLCLRRCEDWAGEVFA